MKVIKAKLSDGLWQGIVSDTEQQPALRVTHLDRDVPNVTVTSAPDAGHWILQFSIPTTAIADGVQTLVISDAQTGDTLDHVTLAAGVALNEDLRAEVDLLRAELDLLKSAFRKHCSETG